MRTFYFLGILTQFNYNFMLAHAAPMFGPFEHLRSTRQNREASQSLFHQAVNNVLPEQVSSYPSQPSINELSLNPIESNHHFPSSFNLYGQNHEHIDLPQLPESYFYDPSLSQHVPSLAPYQINAVQQGIHPYGGSHNLMTPGLIHAPYSLGGAPSQDINVHPTFRNDQSISTETSLVGNVPHGSGYLPRLSHYQWQRDLDITLLDNIYVKMHQAWGPSSKDGLESAFHTFNALIDEEPELLLPIIQGDEGTIQNMARESKRTLAGGSKRAQPAEPWSTERFLAWLHNENPRNFPGKIYQQVMEMLQGGNKKLCVWLPLGFRRKHQERLINAIGEANRVVHRTVTNYMNNWDKESVLPFLVRILDSKNKEDAEKAAVEVYTIAKDLYWRKKHPHEKGDILKLRKRKSQLQKNKSSQQQANHDQEQQLGYNRDQSHEHHQDFSFETGDWSTLQQILWSPSREYGNPNAYHVSGFDTGNGSSSH